MANQKLRYPIPAARRFIMQAFLHLNKVRGTHFALLELGPIVYHEMNFIQANMYDKDRHAEFAVLINEKVFEGHSCAFTVLDTEAKASPNLSDRDLILLRIARLIWRAWKANFKEKS